MTASLVRVIDFLKFAEAKNAALLTFTSAWALAITVILGSHQLSGAALIALPIARALFITAIVLATWSFLPKLRPSAFHRNSEKPKNLLFYGDVASFEFETFAKKLREAYRVEGDVIAGERYLDDLAAQIWINSRITLRKNRLFQVGAVVALAGVITAAAPALMAAIHWLGDHLPGG